jgi:hypothetical protein
VKCRNIFSTIQHTHMPQRRDYRSPCVRCHSDLDGALLVHCSRCPFQMHTYCFTPPLLENPSKKHSNWACSECANQGTATCDSSHEQIMLPMKHVTTTRSTLDFAKARALRPPKHKRPNANTNNDTSRQKSDMGDPPRRPLESASASESKLAFPSPILEANAAEQKPRPTNWKNFCEQKAKALIHENPTERQRPSRSTKQHELMPMAKLKRIALAWIRFRRLENGHIHGRKLQRNQMTLQQLPTMAYHHHHHHDSPKKTKFTLMVRPSKPVATDWRVKYEQVRRQGPSIEDDILRYKKYDARSRMKKDHSPLLSPPVANGDRNHVTTTIMREQPHVNVSSATTQGT